MAKGAFGQGKSDTWGNSREERSSWGTARGGSVNGRGRRASGKTTSKNGGWGNSGSRGVERTGLSALLWGKGGK